jgi:hypothetical protein
MERNRWETAIRCLEVALHPHTSDDEVIAGVNGFRRTADGMPLRQVCAAFAGAERDGRVVSAEAARWRAKLDRLYRENLALRARLKAEEERRVAAESRLPEIEQELRLAQSRADAAEQAFAQFRAAYGERRSARRPDIIPSRRGAAEPQPAPRFEAVLAAARQREPWTA